MVYKWASVGYECSSRGDKRFSALFATMPDGRTIEQWYQCDIKGYQIGGTNWKLGKGRPPIYQFTQEQLFQLYKSLWQLWALHNVQLLVDLAQIAKDNYAGCLSDTFAKTQVNQANALAHILNDWNI